MSDDGFDEGPELGPDDLVVLRRPDGGSLECVLLAVIEHEGSTYALLTPRGSVEDEDRDLLVSAYRESDDGTAHFEPLDDEAVLEALEEVVGTLIGRRDGDAPDDA